MLGKTLFVAVVILTGYASGSSVGDCNFDDGLCKWTDGLQVNVKWIRKASRNPSPISPGMKNDNGKGHHMYVETNNFNGEYATFISPTLDIKEQCQLTFWYSTTGTKNGNMFVSVQKDSGETVWLRRLFVESTGTGETWLKAVIDPRLKDQTIKKYKIIIGWYSDGTGAGSAAIDDIRFEPCPQYVSCNFEKNLCGMQTLERIAGWTRKRDNTITLNTRPSSNHATGSAFLIKPSCMPKVEDYAIIESHVLKMDGPLCLNFWYHMYGKDIGSLKVKVRKAGTTINLASVVFHEKFGKDNSWYNANINLTRKMDNMEYYVISFVAIRGKSSTDDIVIDDIKLTKC